MPSIEERFVDDEYHLERGDAKDDKAADASTNRTTVFVALFAATMFFAAAVALTVYMVMQSSSPTNYSIYTVDSSKYGTPDECEGVTAFCAENKDSGSVKCSCGDYLYEWDEDDGKWVLWNANGNGGGR
jgi:hypothetical protein